MCSRTVLIADDNELIRRVLSFALTEAGHRVIAVGCSADALAVTEPFDVALVDALLDECAPTSLPDELRRRYPRLSIVVMSGLPVDEHYPLADAVLLKPFSLDELQAAIRNSS